MRKNSALLVTLAIMFALVVYVNTGSSNYTVKVINSALLNSMVAYGLSLMLGIGGQLVFSGITFMGMGAYIVANLLTGRLGITTGGTVAILVSIILVGLISFVFGVLFMRLRGVFCTFATIGLVTIMYSLFSFYEPLFGRPDGIAGISSWVIGKYELKTYQQWFYVLLVFVFVTAFIMERIRKSRFGRSLAAVRDDEIAAQTLGVNRYWVRVFAFVIAAIFAAIAGALFAMHNQFVFGNSFSYNQGVNILVMAMLGGINSTPGIRAGALLVTSLPEILRNVSSNMIMLVYGILVILLMIFMPMGLGGIFGKIAKKYIKMLDKLKK